MKKFISLLLSALTVISLLSLVSCDRYDVDLRGKDNVYDDLAVFIKNPDEYEGKTVTLSSTYTVVYDFSQNKVIRHTIAEYDATGSKRALYEIRKGDNKFPRTGSEITLTGRFNKDGFIDVGTIKQENKAPFDFSTFEFSARGIDRFINYHTMPYVESEDFDYDTLTLSNAELTEFIKTYRKEYDKSQHYGETIRIFGHLITDDKGYTYLLGLDAKGKYLWEIELHDPDGRFEFPRAEGNTVNPVEIIGELSTYTEDNILYSCIKVKQVGRVESVFKNDKIDDGFIMP